ncbi:MAG: hypothetical protein KF846_18100 [Cyclobacteriaceae bacterium]|nr:hypothetical protein [Cyclobacteriaceae bacterium]
MKSIERIIIPLLLLVIVAACVDDYTDANPAPLKDGPEIYVYPPTTGVILSTRNNPTTGVYEATPIAYVTKGQNASFRTDVVDAPGLIDSVSTYLSDTVGTVAASGFDVLKGQETGTFSVVYTPRPDDPTSTFDDRIVNMSVTVTDKQNKTTQPRTTRVKAIACVPSIDVAVFWRATASGVSGDDFADGSVLAGGNFTNLKSLVRFQIRTSGGNATVGLNADVENASVVHITDSSFGLYGAQGYAPINGRLTICGNQVTGYTGLNAAGTAFSSQGAHTITGTINANGTMTLNVSNNFGDNFTVTLEKAVLL